MLRLAPNPPWFDLPSLNHVLQLTNHGGPE